MRKIVITGPPASGKSALAAALAARLGRTMVDTDQQLVREAGKTIPELFAQEGESGFRAREKAVFERVLRSPDPAVISTGGGTLLDRELRHRALRQATVLCLDAPTEVLFARAGAEGAARPLLSGNIRERLEALLKARAPSYAEAHAVVPAGGSPEETVRAATRALATLERGRTLVVPLGERSYRVHVEPLAHLPARVKALRPSSTLLVSDAVVMRSVLKRNKGLDFRLQVVLPGRGDRDKTLAQVRRIWDAALEAKLDRDSVVVGVGGGVVTDLAGFAAATLLRGVRYASAPTTLLAMVDASVGGKTGFDSSQGKNLIGAFHQPSLVLCDPRVLRSLPERDLRAGLAEMVKIALVRDEGLLRAIQERVDALARLDLGALSALIPAAIQAKIDVVANDEREGSERALLNFGHTVGHALEQASGYRLPHGECVAIGMRAALALGVRLEITPRAVAQQANQLLDALQLPARAPARLNREAAQAALGSDKKRKEGKLRFVLCQGAGQGRVHPVSAADAKWALSSVLEG